MRQEKKLLIILLFLSPAIGELLSASAPPVQFFNPIMLFLLVLLYGCGTVLIREAKVRWDLQWSVLFLAVAYGIVEEGLLVKSFFNPGWVDMGALSAYGMYLGVQWPWTIMLTMYHATISTLIPIAIIDLLWPEYRYTPLLQRRGLRLALTGITAVTLFGMAFMGTQEGGKMVPFYPYPSLLAGGFIAVALLAWLAHHFRESRISTNRMRVLSPRAFAVGGFTFMALNLLTPSIMAGAGVEGPKTILVQLVIAALALLFVVYQVYHQDVTVRHLVSLIFGSLLLFILLTPIHEFAPGANPDPTTGMLAVGITALFMLILWRRAVLKKTI